MVNKIRELWKTVYAAAGIRWQLLAIFVSIALSRADWIYQRFVKFGILEPGAEGMTFGFPPWILGLTSALFFVSCWMGSYAHKLRIQIQAARVNLSQLRKQGVDLRNNGSSNISNVIELTDWINKTEQWHKDVYEAIKLISVADAEWFDTMDTVPLMPRVPLYNPINDIILVSAHRKRYREHDLQVRRLGEMIRDLWGKS